MKKYKGYILYYLVNDRKRIKQHNFEKLTRDEVTKLDNSYRNREKYIYKGAKLTIDDSI